jgi:hypothetical protein
VHMATSPSSKFVVDQSKLALLQGRLGLKENHPVFIIRILIV